MEDKIVEVEGIDYDYEHVRKFNLGPPHLNDRLHPFYVPGERLLKANRHHSRIKSQIADNNRACNHVTTPLRKMPAGNPAAKRRKRANAPFVPRKFDFSRYQLNNAVNRSGSLPASPPSTGSDQWESLLNTQDTPAKYHHNPNL